MPIVIRNATEFKHLTKLDLDKMIEIYHDYILQDISDIDSKKIINIPFHKYFKDKPNGVYLRLFTDPLDYIIKQEDIDLLMKITGATYTYKNIFMGVNYGKTTMHCHISQTNYIMIKGRKKWTLISPDECSKLIPICDRRETNIFYNSMVNIFDIDYDKFPSMVHIKKDEIILNEGDILMFPAMWWHAVENLDAITIGCDVPYVSVIDSLYQNIDLTLGTIFNYNLVSSYIQGKDINEIVFGKLNGYVDVDKLSGKVQ
jgi:hypothetical protein